MPQAHVLFAKEDIIYHQRNVFSAQYQVSIIVKIVIRMTQQNVLYVMMDST